MENEHKYGLVGNQQKKRVGGKCMEIAVGGKLTDKEEKRFVKKCPGERERGPGEERGSGEREAGKGPGERERGPGEREGGPGERGGGG